MTGALIIGYGNPLRADDGLGWHVAERLMETVNRPDVAIITQHQLTPELAEPISKVALLILIDASEEADPGQFTCTSIEPDSSSLAAFTHHVDPSALLACARDYFGHAPRTLVIAVGGEEFGYGEGLSVTLQNTLPNLVSAIESLIARELGPGAAQEIEQCHDLSLIDVTRENW